jgi:phosphoadenosine phosphosulfate reductase
MEIPDIKYIDKIQQLSPLEGLQYFANNYGNAATFSTSFGIEDQVITHLIASNNLPISIFTLDTGRMFQETYSTWNTVKMKYDISINTFYPNATALENMVTSKGPNSFYESIENRKECCNIRKVEPLKRALNGKKIWITGIRAEQSNNRQLDTKIEWDKVHQLYKYHPLLDWTFDEVNNFVKENGVPVNPLHQKGFVSIGCAPCTRAIKEGEDFRAGRWWWEDDSKKECGLHSR